MDASIVAALTNYGLPGVLIAALIVWNFRLTAKLSEAYEARIGDAKSFTERAIKLQEGVHRSIDKLEALTDVLVRRAADE